VWGVIWLVIAFIFFILGILVGILAFKVRHPLHLQLLRAYGERRVIAPLTFDVAFAFLLLLLLWL
jgi:hypothetical protein